MVKERLEHITYSIQSSISEESNYWLEKLYGSSYATKTFAEVYFSTDEIYTFTISENYSGIKHVIVFKKKEKRINVINQVCKIENKYVELFCTACFKKFERIDTISFSKIYTEPKIDSYKFYITELHDDYIIYLPESFDAYHSMLGKKLRRNLNQSLNHLKRDYPDYDFFMLEKQNIPPSLIEKAAEFNRKRMREKGRVSSFNTQMLGKIAQRLRTHGFVSGFSINGEVMSLLVNTAVGNNFFSHIISHDPKYNYYRLGQVTLYLTINEMIKKECTKLHMLWGEYEFKYKFKGKKTLLYSYDVLRDGRLLKWRKFTNQLKKWKTFIQSLTFLRVFRFIKRKTKELLK